MAGAGPGLSMVFITGSSPSGNRLPLTHDGSKSLLTSDDERAEGCDSCLTIGQHAGYG
eukprot:CAMPEP_0202880184 /NCGR_PEP_ID=MMETSP1391-20130828/34746_1 /ASSEMBLY_ACC=CAM_ASM_000867 /TAXON_ID=1034604 /ORGANISM="Chlamydomonas leiostraca, Strain SAG 11-49" /LENGTH=57 /DNA_ID=CAMNT_0049562653 /DNA_START=122 /DNA_END=292 /DNA_ORIENTATION=-